MVQNVKFNDLPKIHVQEAVTPPLFSALSQIQRPLGDLSESVMTPHP